MAMNPPPPMPAPAPPGGPPPQGGGGMPAELQPDTIVSALPDGDFSMKAMKRLADSINDAIPVLAPEVEQKIELPPEMKAGVQGKLPPMLAVPAVVILTVASGIEPRYAMAPSAFTDDKAVTKASSLIDAAVKDKAILAAVKGEPAKKSKGGPMPEENDVSEEIEMKEEIKEKAPPPAAAKYM